MIKEESYQVKFELLHPWANEILNAVKKELKSEHLMKNPQFVHKHFPRKIAQKLTIEEMTGAYIQEIKEGNEEIGELVASRWVLKHAEMYHFFAEELTKINPKFDEIERISDEQSVLLIEMAESRFGASKTYVFSILNSVQFADSPYAALRQRAENAPLEAKIVETPSLDISVEELRKKHAQEILKLTEKYENRLLGVQKKYAQEVEGLKKQIAGLHRKLQG